MRVIRPVFLNLLYLALIALSAGFVYGRIDPVKPAAPSTSPTDPGGVEEFVCGTAKGSEKGSFWHYYLYRNQLREISLGKKPQPQPSVDFINDDVWVVEDDGTLLFSGLNVFDTDFQSFRFQPNGVGGYDISSVPFNFDGTLGTNLNLGDDTNATVSIGFTFSYFGTNWTQVHVNANGIVAFGADINPSGFFDNDDFFSGVPKIAPYFIDLNPESAGGVFVKSEAAKLTLTWNNIPEFGAANSNTLQLVIRSDNTFDITFNGIDATLALNGLPITLGIHPGGAPNLDLISFSGDLPFNGAAGTGIYEYYLNITDPLVNEVALLQRFYQAFPDSFFQIVFFTNFKQTMAGFANERNIKNAVQGIGLPLFDNSGLYGSNGILESRCNMNRLSVWPVDPTQRSFGSQNNFLTIMGQEAGHRWGAFINFQDSTGNPSNMILGRSDAHWSYYVDVDHSSLEGGNWEHVAGDQFTTPTKIDFFGDIDEYIFGLRTPQEVTPTFYVSSPTNDLPQNRSKGTPVQGATAFGVPIEVTIGDIIAAEGPRIPVEADSPKDLRQAFVLLVKNGVLPTQAELNKIAGFRRAWEDYFEVSVDGRFAVNTSLTRTFPVAVIKGQVIDELTQLPVENFLIKSLERGFSQFVPSGGRYTFRYMASSTSGTGENLTLPVEAPGYFPDTLVTSVPYGTEISVTIKLMPIPTGIEKVVPLVDALHQNYPNPFNPITTITYELKGPAKVSLRIYDVNGRLVRTLVDGHQTAGSKRAAWDGRNDRGDAVSSGIYLYRVETPHYAQSRKMVLIK